MGRDVKTRGQSLSEISLAVRSLSPQYAQPFSQIPRKTLHRSVHHCRQQWDSPVLATLHKKPFFIQGGVAPYMKVLGYPFEKSVAWRRASSSSIEDAIVFGGGEAAFSSQNEACSHRRSTGGLIYLPVTLTILLNPFLVTSRNYRNDVMICQATSGDE